MKDGKTAMIATLGGFDCNSEQKSWMTSERALILAEETDLL